MSDSLSNLKVILNCKLEFKLITDAIDKFAPTITSAVLDDIVMY